MNCELCLAREMKFFDSDFEVGVCEICRDDIARELRIPGGLRSIFSRRWGPQKSLHACDICNDRPIRSEIPNLQLRTCSTCRAKLERRLENLDSKRLSGPTSDKRITHDGLPRTDEAIDHERVDVVTSYKVESSDIRSLTAQEGGIGSRRDLEAVVTELEGLVGLEEVKADVRQLVAFLEIQRRRKLRGLPVVDLSLHLVFCGNPGTGKTTVARCIAEIYRQLGFLSRGHLVETDRAGLVAGYLGQTALKVKEVVQQALGGILFVDEAYALVQDRQDSYGGEAVATLLKAMEDFRDDFVVIVAGYPGQMETFLNANPGLRSRFNKYFQFKDYLPSQLVEIFEQFCTKNGYRLAPSTRERVTAVFQDAYVQRTEGFGNARFARNVFERALERHAARAIAQGALDSEGLSTLQAEDIAWP